MKIQEFIQHFAEQFEELNVNTVTAQTAFKDLDEWSSLVALSIIAMVDEEYGVALKGEDIRSAITIEDLFNIIKSRKQNQDA